MSTKTVILIGATGLIGQACLKLLTASPSYENIKIFTRRPLPFPVDTAHVRVQVLDFAHLADYSAEIRADQLICTLGTTLKKAGSKANFYQVDFTFPYQFAKLALEHGAEHLLLVTSNGANPHSRIFYPRVKGELEVAVQKLGYRSLSIFRPSLLLGARAEYRWREEMAGRLASILAPLIPARYRPIPAPMVAGAMVQVATADQIGTRIYESDQIRQIYEKYYKN
jgi:uncharacterized protein YbjT (DUF2867 family)